MRNRNNDGAIIFISLAPAELFGQSFSISALDASASTSLFSSAYFAYRHRFWLNPQAPLARQGIPASRDLPVSGNSIQIVLPQLTIQRLSASRAAGDISSRINGSRQIYTYPRGTHGWKLSAYPARFVVQTVGGKAVQIHHALRYSQILLAKLAR